MSTVLDSDAALSFEGYTAAALQALGVDGAGESPVMIISAHPDDEAIGTAALLRHLKKATVVHLTDGSALNMKAARARGYATRGEYAKARSREVDSALAGLPFRPERVEIGIPDLELSYNLVYLIKELARHMAGTGARAVLTHPYEGGHPDHDSAALAVRAAVTVIEREGRRAPKVMEFPSYNGLGGKMSVYEFIPLAQTGTITVRLTLEERDFKRAFFAHYRTQKKVLETFPTEAEFFRQAPLYDFLKPPHRGRLFYEKFDWGIGARRWRELARKALNSIDLETAGGPGNALSAGFGSRNALDLGFSTAFSSIRNAIERFLR